LDPVYEKLPERIYKELPDRLSGNWSPDPASKLITWKVSKLQPWVCPDRYCVNAVSLSPDVPKYALMISPVVGLSFQNVSSGKFIWFRVELIGHAYTKNELVEINEIIINKHRDCIDLNMFVFKFSKRVK
jgi:hypothetical protein